MQLNDQLAAKTLAFVLAGGAGRRLDPLTKYRPKPLVPFGGYFRILDFTLSNCLNSGLDCAYVLTQHDNESMATYLRKGWSRFGGAHRQFTIPRPAAGGSRYLGTADAIFQNISLLQEHGSTFVLVLSADHIYKMDYRRLLGFHAAKGAEVTIATVDYPAESSSDFGVLDVDEDQRVVGFEEKPRDRESHSNGRKTVPVNMGVYVFNVGTLLKTLERSDAPLLDIALDLIPRLLGSSKVLAYRHQNEFNARPLYWRDVGTPQAYYDASMDLLASNPRMNPFESDWPIRSGFETRLGRKVLSDVGSEAGVDSVIPCAAHIDGASVFRSVLSLGVVLESGAEVKHSVLLPGAVIKRGASVRNAIIDAHVVIESGDRVGYSKQQDQSRFHVLSNGVVVVSPDHMAPFFKVGALAGVST